MTIPSSTAFRPRLFSAVLHSLLYDWTTRLMLASVYALAFFVNVSALLHIIAKAKHHESLVSTALSIAVDGATAAFVAFVAATILTRLPAIRKSEGMAPRIAAVFGTYLAFALAFLPRQDLPPAILALSSFLLIVGMVTSFAVLSWLGKAFSIMPEARQLVTHGPYALIRHPLYLCEEIAVIGLFIQVISPVAVAMLVVQIAFQYRRMLNEERVLSATFPDYEDYARRTPRLIPAHWFGRPIA